MRSYTNSTQSELNVSRLRLNDYSSISEAFDASMGEDFADIIEGPMVEYVRKRFGRGKKFRHLDIGCGTGVLLLRLSQRFQTDAFGVDYSKGQIRQARLRAEREGINASFSVGDMRTAKLPAACDLITCNFDALNHVREIDDWKKILERVRNSLRPGGAFLFDLNTPKRVISDWRNPEVVIKPNLCYMHCGLALQRSGSVVRRQLLMQLFSRTNQFYKRATAIIEETAIPNEAVLHMLRDVGFSKTRVRRIDPRLRAQHVFMRNRAFFEAEI